MIAVTKKDFKKIEDAQKKIPDNTLLDDLEIENYKENKVKNESITWKWDYETGATEDEIIANDKLDTALGNAAADADTSKHPGINLTITCTVTQID